MPLPSDGRDRNRRGPILPPGLLAPVFDPEFLQAALDIARDRAVCINDRRQRGGKRTVRVQPEACERRH